MTKKLPVAIALLFISAFVSQAALLERIGAPRVSWTSYKTPAKLAVGGTFDRVTADLPERADSLAGLLKHASLTIQTDSVNSGNPARDRLIVQHFFGLLEGKTIRTDTVSVTGNDQKGTVTISVNMNGVRRDVPLRYTVEAGHFHGDGYIDLSDFQAQTALAALTKVCIPHKGKTWLDVRIAFDLDLKRSNGPQ